MALYDYRCEECGKVDELDLPMTLDLPKVLPCNACKGAMRRVFSVPTITFKGVGWAGKPAIFNDPIAAGHPQQETNWGVEDPKNYGVPLGDPYKKIVELPAEGATEV